MQEETNQKQVDDWRDEVGEQKEVLKIVDMESVQFTFQDEGVKKTHADYGDSVVFGVLHTARSNELGMMKIVEAEGLVWYVNAKNFDLRKQIKELGTLTGLKVEVGRTGSKKSDTRYTIKKVDE